MTTIAHHRELGRILATIGILTATLCATSASAQGYDNSGSYYRGPNETVEVYGPPPPRERSAIGAPIENVSVSREVRYDDLDLRTEWGAHVLRARIVRTARAACRELDRRYPSSYYPATSDSPPCVEWAVDRAMDQADAAINDARHYASRE